MITSPISPSVQNFIKICSQEASQMDMKYNDFVTFYTFPSIFNLVVAYSKNYCTDFNTQRLTWRGFAQGNAFWSFKNDQYCFLMFEALKNVNFGAGIPAGILLNIKKSRYLQNYKVDRNKTELQLSVAKQTSWVVSHY